MKSVRITGRSSSHFTRVTRIFARELGVPVELSVVSDMTQLDAAAYAENPALKLPSLHHDGWILFGTENICRALSELSEAPLRVVWPEALPDAVSRNAQELVWHGMAAQVALVMGTVIGKLPTDNLYFAKLQRGFAGALGWLDENLAAALAALPRSRDLSLFEVTLFCLVDHLDFRPTLSLEAHPSLVRFRNEFADRPSARETAYRFDAPLAQARPSASG